MVMKNIYEVQIMNIYVQIYTYIHTIYIHTYTYTYIHTHTYTYMICIYTNEELLIPYRWPVSSRKGHAC